MAGHREIKIDPYASLRVRQKKCNKLGGVGQSLVSDATHMTHEYKSDLKEGRKEPSRGKPSRRWGTGMRRQWLSLKNALIVCEIAAGLPVCPSLGLSLAY